MDDKELYAWLQNQRKLSPFNTPGNTNMSYFQDMYGSEYDNWNTQNKATQRYEDVTNFNSPMYQKYREYLQSVNPEISPNSLLASPMAGGFSYGASQKLATERAQTMNTKRGEDINRGVTEFALGNQGQASGLLNMLLQNSQFGQQLREQRRQFDESQPSFWDSLLNLGAGLGGSYLGGGGLFGRGTSGIPKGGRFP